MRLTAEETERETVRRGPQKNLQMYKALAQVGVFTNKPKRIVGLLVKRHNNGEKGWLECWVEMWDFGFGLFIPVLRMVAFGFVAKVGSFQA